MMVMMTMAIIYASLAGRNRAAVLGQSAWCGAKDA